MSQAYPLQWPAGWPRTMEGKREQSRFKTTLYASLEFLKKELSLLGAKELLLSSNVTLGAERPRDPGVCAYFHYQGLNAAIPCDRWLRVEDNVHAIAKTVEAMRGIERWGAKNMIKAAFTGFQALPPPTDARPWWQVLKVGEGATLIEAQTAYRRLATENHPDKGGSSEEMAAINAAMQQARESLS